MEGTKSVAPLERGVEVVLREAAFGYEAGARGVVLRFVGDDVVYVRFASTGHTLAVPMQLVRRPAPDVVVLRPSHTSQQ
jgi:hypothetical protein